MIDRVLEASNLGEARGQRLYSFMQKYAIYLALLLLCVAMTIVSTKFMTSQNLVLVLNQVAINGLLAIGVTYVLITGGIDISVGSVVGLAGVLAALSAPAGSNVPLALPIAVALMTGLGVGVVNGTLVTKGKMAPFIVTLGMMTILRGLSLIVSGGRPVSSLIEDFAAVGKLPVPIFIFVAVAVVAHIQLHHFKVGRHLFAVGGNSNAAFAAGLKPDRTRFFAYVTCSALAGLAGMVLASRIVTGHPNSGQGFELDAIAAAVVGGTSLAGGSGSVGGTVVGALIIGVLGNGMDLLGVSSYWQQVVKGAIIIGAVLLDRHKKRQ